MIIETEDKVFLLKKDEDETVRAIPSFFGDAMNSEDWIVITEDAYGDFSSVSMTKTEIESEYGNFPETE